MEQEVDQTNNNEKMKNWLISEQNKTLKGISPSIRVFDVTYDEFMGLTKEESKHAYIKSSPFDSFYKFSPSIIQVQDVTDPGYYSQPPNPVSILMVDEGSDFSFSENVSQLMDMSTSPFDNEPILNNNITVVIKDTDNIGIDHHRIDKDIMKVPLEIIKLNDKENEQANVLREQILFPGRKPKTHSKTRFSTRKKGKPTRLQRRQDIERVKENPNAYPKTPKKFPLIDAQNAYAPTDIADISKLSKFSFDDVPHEIPIFSLNYPKDGRYFRTRINDAVPFWSSTPPIYDPPPSTIIFIPIIYEALLRFMINVRSPSVSKADAAENSDSMCFSFKKAHSNFDFDCVLLDDTIEIAGLDHSIQNMKGKMLFRRACLKKDSLLFVFTKCPETDGVLTEEIADQIYQLALDRKRELMKMPHVIKKIERQKFSLRENFQPRPFDPKMDPALECTCGYWASSKKDFDIHFESNCKIKFTETKKKEKKNEKKRKRPAPQPIKEPQAKKATTDDISSLTCEHEGCGLSFTTYLELRTHKKTHLTKHIHCEIEGCNSSFSTTRAYEFHKQNHTPGSHLCELCGKISKSLDSLKSHKRAVHTDKRYSCTMEGCTKSFKHKTDLKIHFDEHRGQIYKCEESDCNSEYKSYDSYRHHKRTAHTDKRYSCTMEGCTRSFKRTSELKIHLDGHRGQIYKCQESGCNREYKSYSAYRSHKRDHKNLLYRCDFAGCFKEYRRSNELLKHKRNKHAGAENP